MNRPLPYEVGFGLPGQVASSVERTMCGRWGLAMTHSCPLPSRVLAVMPWVPSCALKLLPSEEAVAARALSL